MQSHGEFRCVYFGSLNFTAGIYLVYIFFMNRTIWFVAAETEICIVHFAMANWALILAELVVDIFIYFLLMAKNTVWIAVQTDFCFLKRREFVFSAALPFLLSLHESVEGFKAEAGE